MSCPESLLPLEEDDEVDEDELFLVLLAPVLLLLLPLPLAASSYSPFFDRKSFVAKSNQSASRLRTI
jgi:hypothetical protein